MKILKNLQKEEHAQGVWAYSLLLALIAVYFNIGQAIVAIYNVVHNTLNNAANMMPK